MEKDFARLFAAWWWLLVAVVAAIATGLIQYGKGLAPKRTPKRLWALLLPVLCVAIALAMQPWPWWLLLALLGLILAQLGWDVILQALIAWMRRLAGIDLVTALAEPEAPRPPGIAG